MWLRSATQKLVTVWDGVDYDAFDMQQCNNTFSSNDCYVRGLYIWKKNESWPTLQIVYGMQ